MEFGPHGGPFFNRTRDPSVIVPFERDLPGKRVPPDCWLSSLRAVAVVVCESLF